MISCGLRSSKTTKLPQIRLPLTPGSTGLGKGNSSPQSLGTKHAGAFPQNPAGRWVWPVCRGPASVPWEAAPVAKHPPGDSWAESLPTPLPQAVCVQGPRGPL